MLKLPEWFDGYRPGQTDAIRRVLDGFDDHDVVMLDAPTGSGKTIIAESIRQHLGFSHALYLATTKSLQDQVVHDFPWAKVIKGRSNYPTADYPERFGSRIDNLSAADCTKSKELLPACGSCPDGNESEEEVPHCHWCHPVHRCHYNIAKQIAVGAPLGVANISYFLTECNKGPQHFSGADLVIIDEADRLEAELLGFAEVYISKRRQEQWNLPAPERKTVPEAWQAWVNEIALPRLSEVYRALKGQEPQTIRERRVVGELLHDLKDIDLLAGNYVYTGYDRGEIRFRPVRVDDWARRILWPHGRRFLLMSATIISPTQLASDLGIDSYSYVAMPSTFPKDRRPIVARPVADMGRSPRRPGDAKGKLDETERVTRVAGEREALAAELERILAAHPTDRILVHTVSYDLTAWLLGRLDNSRCLAYNSAHDRDAMLDRFRQTDGAVLLAPSLDRGIDLPYDACRVVVVAKVPFPDLSDRQISTRLHSADGDSWYRVQAVRTLVQMVGRGMRAPDDECATYILDRQFVTNLWKRSSQLFPSWFTESVSWTGQLPSGWLGGEAA